MCQKCLVIEIYSRLDCDIVFPVIRSHTQQIVELPDDPDSSRRHLAFFLKIADFLRAGSHK